MDHELGDIEALLNLREWLRKALEGNGAKSTGSGIGMGGADLWVELEGYEYFVHIKPVEK